MYELISRHEQLFNAASMAPGIVMALFIAKWGKYHNLFYPICAHVVLCIASMTYHSYYYYYQFHPQMLRIDLLCQQLGLIVYALYSPLGYSSLFCMLPFIYVSTCLANLQDARESLIAQLMTAVLVIILFFSVTAGIEYNRRLVLVKIATFMLFIIRYIKENPLSHGFFHFSLHYLTFCFFDVLTKYYV
jgi:hypothetical protein